MRATFKKVEFSKFRDFEKISMDFANGSETAYAFEYYNAAGVPVIHAAIALADSVTIRLAGKKCSGESHYEVIELLRQVVPASEKKNKALDNLKKMIDHKNRVSYQGDVYNKKDIDKLLKYFHRFNVWTESLPRN